MDRYIGNRLVDDQTNSPAGTGPIRRTVGVFALGVQLFLPGAALAVGDTDEATDPPEVVQAQALVDAERYEEAVEYIQGAIAVFPNNADLHSLLGFAYRNLGSLDPATLAYDVALEIDPQHQGALEYQGELFLILGQRALAERNLAKLEKVCGKTCEAYVELEAAIAAAD